MNQIMNKKTIGVVLWSGVLILLAGCSLGGVGGSLPAAQPAKASNSDLTGGGAIRLASDPLPGQPQMTCPVPAGWVRYPVAFNETIYSIAARGRITAADLLKANCLPAAYVLKAGVWLAVPPEAAATSPQTFLPLGVGAFVVDPVVVPVGGTITLAWQTQGPVVSVRLGWMYGEQFVEEANGLPVSGTWTLRVPDDGRESITYVVRAGDGVTEVSAQTTVRVRCGEGWFFNPAPPGCPLPPLFTTFEEQTFERGTIVYVPALRVHYVLAQGYPARQIADTFTPGMPLTDPALEAGIPAGLRQPRGPINAAWRSNNRLQAALGYAVGEAHTYTGMHQRTVSASGETIYFSSGAGAVYRFVEGQAWQVITPE